MNTTSCSIFRSQKSPSFCNSFVISSREEEKFSKGQNDTLQKQDFHYGAKLEFLPNADNFDSVKLKEPNFEHNGYFLLKKLSHDSQMKEDSNQDSRVGLQHLLYSKAHFFQCEVCGKGFQRKYTLNRHLRSHLPNPVRHQCKVCGRAYMHRYHLKRHFDAHCGKVGIQINVSGLALLY